MKTYMMSTRLQITADDVLSDVSFQKNNSLDNFPAITKTTSRSKPTAGLFIENEKLVQEDLKANEGLC